MSEVNVALRVVLADDSALFRDGLAALLTAAGVEVVAVAGDVPGAYAAAAEHRPDVVVLDVRMPPTHTDEASGRRWTCTRSFPSWGCWCSPPTRSRSG